MRDDKMKSIREYGLGKQDMSKYKKVLEHGFKVTEYGIKLNWNPPKVKWLRRRFLVRHFGKKRRRYGLKKYILKRKNASQSITRRTLAKNTHSIK